MNEQTTVLVATMNVLEATLISNDKGIWIVSSPENSVLFLCFAAPVVPEGASQVAVCRSQQGW